MRLMHSFIPFLVIGLLFLAGCSVSDDERIEEMVEDLAGALNSGDRDAAARLYADDSLHPLTLSGDSSTIYRLLTIPGGSDFEVENVTSAVIMDNAQTTFDLIGEVHRGDSLVGTMTLRLKMELEKVGDGWRFVPGAETRESGI